MESIKNLFCLLLDNPVRTIEDALSSLPGSRTSKMAFVGVALCYTAYRLLRKRYKLPPGPTGLPLLGNILSFRGVPIYQKLKEWENKYGPVMTIYLGPMRCVVLNRIDVVLEALVTKQEDFAGRPYVYSAHVMSEGGKSIAFSTYGPTWKLHRKLAAKALRYYLSGNRLGEIVFRSVSAAIEGIRAEKGPFDPHPYISHITFNVLCGICFSEIYDRDDERYVRLITVLDKATEEYGNGLLEDVIPPLRICPTSRFRRIMKATDQIRDFIYERIDEHRKTYSADELRDLTDAILFAQKEAEDDGETEMIARITDTHVGQTLNDIIGAGLDTSRVVLHWVLLHMAAYQDIQANVHKELDSVMDSRRLPTMADRAKLPYTEATLHESMRIAHGTPIGVPHATTCDTTIGQYEIPKSTMVLINHWSIHLNPEQWEGAETFNPERFLDKSGKLAPKPASWLPFSTGRRGCLGESLAKPELHLVFSGLMRNFRFSLSEGLEPDLEPQSGGFAYLPKEYELVAEERE